MLLWSSGRVMSAVCTSQPAQRSENYIKSAEMETVDCKVDTVDAAHNNDKEAIPKPGKENWTLDLSWLDAGKAEDGAKSAKK